MSMSHHEGDAALIIWCLVATRATVMRALCYTPTRTAARRRLPISTHATLRPRLARLARVPG